MYIYVHIHIYKLLLSAKPVARLTVKPVFLVQRTNTSKPKKDRMDWTRAFDLSSLSPL